MPTEFRFEDLDLREEPGHARSEASDVSAPCTYTCTRASAYCTKSAGCTDGCCTDGC